MRFNGGDPPGDVGNGTAPLALGAFVGSTEIATTSEREATALTLDGLMDEVEIFDRILLQSEVQAIVDAGSNGKCKPSPSP